MSTLVEAEVRNRLLQDPAVSELIDDRMFPGMAPQDSDLPYIVFQRISTRRQITMVGPNELFQPRIQIDSWSESYLEAKELSDRIRLALNGLANTSGGVVRIDLAFLDDEIEDLDRPKDSSEVPTYRITQDYLVWTRETP